MRDIRRVVLVGFSGSGKSTVALMLAARLNWQPVDLDIEIEIEAGRTIPEIFATDGEAVFRATEQRHLARALARDRVVIATGGGAVVDPAVWSDDLLESRGTLVVALDAQPEVVLNRLRRQQASEGDAATRPLLAVADPLARIVSLKHDRQAAYDRAHLTLVVDAVMPEEAADEIAELVVRSSMTPAVRLEATSGSSAVHIGAGVTAYLGELVRERWPKVRRVWIVSDANVDPLHGDTIAATFAALGCEVRRKAVPAGEGSKHLTVVSDLYDWMLGSGIERGDVVVALGGGVIGDLAGFVAATVLRGVGLVQVPTSLLAMVDSSIGGKTGIDHAVGKNLIGAFYQPPLVVIDTAMLETLPERQLRAGFAEIIKHAVIQPSTPGGDRGDLMRLLERNQRGLLAGAEPAMTYLVQRNVALKAAVVQADEKESGIRAFLNFGHTLGHAIEAAGYTLLHGEAVSVGMRAAMRIGRQLGTTFDPALDRLDGLLAGYGLPLTATVDRSEAMGYLGSDKKRAAGKQRWVLPLNDGGVTISSDVPLEVAEAALAEVTTQR